MPLYAALLPRLSATPVSAPVSAPASVRRAAAVGVVVNAVSHPLLWFVLQPLGRWADAPTVAVIATAELAVWLVEAVLVRVLTPAGWPASLAVSAVANLASIAVGLLLLILR